MLKVDGLSKKFGQTKAVDGVSFCVEKGDSFGLLGPNGAGKTTTISMIAGTLDADSGLATLDGHPIGSNLPEAKKLIGYVPQEIALYEDISARANLRVFCALYDLHGKEAEIASDKVLELVGLREREDDQVRKFSGGMKRRLNIAVGLVHSPELLILDEPTVGVDPQSRNAIFDTLLELRSEGTTILYTTHYMEEVERLCKYVAIMDKGRIVTQGDLNTLKNVSDGPQLVTLELSEPAKLQAGQKIPGAESWTATDSSLTIEIPDLGQGLSDALIFLTSQGLKIIALKSRQTSLEEIFLDVTGRDLRDSVNA
jgi:ABC-2 type transport system ATP-binding protein